MSSRLLGNRSEPVRTRKASKKDKHLASTGDIVEAFSKVKMASKTGANALNKDEMSKASDSMNNSANEPSLALNQKSIKETKDAITQVLPIDFDNEDEQDSPNAKTIGVSIDSNKEEILDALKELTEKFTKLDDIINHPKKGIGAQVCNLTLKGDNLYTDIHSASDGLLLKMANLQKDVDVTKQSTQHMEAKQERITKMLAENKRLSMDLVTTQGLLQKYSQKIQVLEAKVLDLTRRGMEQNLIFHAVEEADNPKEEDCYETIRNFAEAYLQVELEETEIWRAYRMGEFRSDRARPIFAKLAYSAKDRIMENVSALKDKRNPHGQVRFVAEQIPEGIVEIKKNIGKRASQLRAIEEKKPPTEQRPIKITGNKILVGGFVEQKEVDTPQPMDLFPSADEQKKINGASRMLKEAEPLYAGNSTFVGLAMEVNSVRQTNLAYKAVAQRFPYMDHIMMAYQFKLEDGTIKYGACDDNEHGGGSCIGKFLHTNREKDVAVFVVRRYGGIHLGINRFKAIEKAAAEAIKLLRPPGPPSAPPQNASHSGSPTPSRG